MNVNEQLLITAMLLTQMETRKLLQKRRISITLFYKIK